MKYQLGLALSLTIACGVACASDNWLQYQFDSEHSGNAPSHQLVSPLGLRAAIPLTDAVFTAPAIADGRIYALDGSGVLFCVDVETCQTLWKFASPGGSANINNYSSPAVAAGFVHFGTMAGVYFVLDAIDGHLVTSIDCGEPIFSCPVIGTGAVYFATLGSQVYSLSPDGQVRWKWDYVREILNFDGDRWDGEAWLKHKKQRVTWREQFLCSRNLAVHKKTLVIPAGGSIVWLEDRGDHARNLGGFAPNESPATLGMSLGSDGTVYRQWFRRDNTGRVEVLNIVDNKVQTSFVPGTETSYYGDESMAFSAVAIRGKTVYRCRPEEGVGICRHADGTTLALGDYPSIAPPILAGDRAVVSGLDGRLAIVPLDGNGEHWVFKTPFGKPITAPAAVANGLVVFGGEDGYLYILAHGASAPLPAKQLNLSDIRHPLTGNRTEAQYNWDRHFGNQANTNRTNQELKLPLTMRWIRRCQGTIKHLSTIGGGRVYTHTAEGQVTAVEQETGRLLWRVYYPGVHVSFTTPAYHHERLYLPQAGLKKCRLRCLDAATGNLVWEAPFAGSPSWNRQLTPIITDGLIFYQFSSGTYTGRTWLFEHQSTFGFSSDQKPIVRAWNLETGKEAWSLDFSQYGHGGDDAGMCLADGTLFYSCYFGGKGPTGVTAALVPKSGKIKWLTTDYSVHAGCTPSVANNRLYLGGYNPVEVAIHAVDGKEPVEEKINRVWCLDATNGQLVWQSDPIERAIHVVTIGDGRLFTHAQYRQGYLLDPANGKKLCELTQGYRCTRFTMDGAYLLGPNMDIIDTSQNNALVSTGPAVDVLLCVGAQISNGRLFYTANGSGLQLSMNYGAEAQEKRIPWMRSGPPDPRGKNSWKN